MTDKEKIAAYEASFIRRLELDVERYRSALETSEKRLNLARAQMAAGKPMTSALNASIIKIMGAA